MIFKFQQGGSAIPPLVSYQPVMVTGEPGAVSTTSSADSSKSEGGSNLTDKDLLKMMEKLEGLPNDMQAVTEALSNFYIDQQYSPFPNTTNIASRYLQALQMMRTANFNRKQYDDAFTIVSKNGGINELAINERGQLICINKDGDFKYFLPEELKENPGYSPITNSELLRWRAYNPELANDNKILGIVANGIGIKSVMDYIGGIIGNLGTNSEVREGFTSTSSKEVLSGLQAFQKASQEAVNSGRQYDGTVDNLYKGKLLTQSQAQQAEYALRFIYKSLPQNAKTLLKTKAETADDKGALQMLGELIQSQITNKSEFTMIVDTPSTSKAGSSDSSTKTGTPGAIKLDPVALLQAGYGQKQTITILTGEGGQNGIQVPTVSMPIVSKEGESMGVGTLSDVAKSGFAGYLNLENVTMGGVRIDPTGFQNVAVNGTQLYTAYLPVDSEEYTNTGNIRPNINMLKRLKAAQNEIKEGNITNKQKINEIYEAHSLPVMFDGQGDVLSGNYQKFALINGAAIEQAFSENAEVAEWLSETTDENVVNNVLNIIQKGRSKEDRIAFNAKNWYNGIFGSYDHVYKGTIFIPVNEDYFTYSAAMGESLTPGQAEDIEARQQAAPREAAANKLYNNPGAFDD